MVTVLKTIMVRVMVLEIVVVDGGDGGGGDSYGNDEYGCGTGGGDGIIGMGGGVAWHGWRCWW